MLKLFENKLLSAGMARIDRVAAAWFYALFLAWNVTEMQEHWNQPPPASFLFLYVDCINIITVGIGLTFAVERHRWLERVAAVVLSFNIMSQLALQAAHSASTNTDLPIETLYSSLFFSTYFLLRSLGLSVRIAQARELNERSPKYTGEK